MNGKNIPDKIQEGLNARLEAMSTFGETTLRSPLLNPVSEQTTGFKLSRQAVESCSPYVRMIGNAPNNSIYMMAGMFNVNTDSGNFDKIESDISYLHTRPSTSNLTGGEGFYELGKGEDITQKKFGYKEPGITSLSVTNLTDGAKGGAVKKASINFTVWHMPQMNEFQRHSFLSLGAAVIIDWGWVRADKDTQAILEPPSILKKEGEKIELDYDLFKEALNPETNRVEPSVWSQLSEEKYGDWDGMIGVISKVDWKITEEGGFECTIEVLSKGSNVFDDPLVAKERQNPKVALDPSYGGIRDIETFKYLFYKNALESRELTEEEKKHFNAENIEQILANTKTGPEVSLSERINSLDVEIIMKFFPDLAGIDGKPKKEKKPDTQVGISENSEVLMLYTPHKILDKEGKPTKKYGSSVLSRDEKTKELHQNTQFKYDIWVNWGWFEDNVVSYYGKKFGYDKRPDAVFRSIIGDTPVKIKNSPHLYTFTNDFLIPGQTPETWFPSKIGDPKNPVDNPYKKLAQELNGKCPAFADNDKKRRGYLRHLYVNLNLIKSAFGGPGISISGGMLSLADSLNSGIKLWDFQLHYSPEEVANLEGNPTFFKPTYYLTETREEADDKKPNYRDPSQSYIFENNGLNSLIQSCEISTDMSSRLAAQAYMGRETVTNGAIDLLIRQGEIPTPESEEVMNMARFYAVGAGKNAILDEIQKGEAGDLGSQTRKLYYGAIPNNIALAGLQPFVSELTDDGLKPSAPLRQYDAEMQQSSWNHDIPEHIVSLYPNSTSNKLAETEKLMKQIYEQGQADVDFNSVFGGDIGDQTLQEFKELKMYAFPAISAAQVEEYEKDDTLTMGEKNAKFPYQSGVDMHFNWLRTLDFYLSENPLTSLLSVSKKNEVVFLPINATITIDGCGGINLLNMFRLAYLPELYKQNKENPGTYFLITAVDHEIGNDGWKTNIKGQILQDLKHFLDLPENDEDIDPEDKLRQLMEESFEKVWEEAIEVSTKDQTEKEKPEPKKKPKPKPKTYTVTPMPETDSTGTLSGNMIEIEPGVFKMGKPRKKGSYTGGPVNSGNTITRIGHENADDLPTVYEINGKVQNQWGGFDVHKYLNPTTPDKLTEPRY